jgi:hypothetical protein
MEPNRGTKTLMAPPTLFMVVVGEVLHLWLGWPLWAGVVIVGILATGPGVVQLLGGKATDNEETDKGQERYVRIGFALSAIGATLIAAVLAYIPLIIVNWLMKNPSW